MNLDSLTSFLDASPSPWHAAHTAVQELEALVPAETQTATMRVELCRAYNGLGRAAVTEQEATQHYETAAALAKRLVATRLQLLDLYDVSGGRQVANSALSW